MKAMTLKGNKSWATSVGIYLIVLLALLRLLIYPLHTAVKERRAELDKQRGRNDVKMRVLEQARQIPQENSSRDVEKMQAALHPRASAVTRIQADILIKMIELSESKGMSVTGYEMPEAVTVGKMTEIPVIFRLKGRAESLVAVLEEIGKQKKILVIKSMDVSAAGQELTVSLIMQALRSEI